MKLTDFDALTFDCYGTLIDWESGIAAALRAWAGGHGIAADDNELLEAFSRHENRIEAEHPAMLYPQVLARTLRDVAADYGVRASAEEEETFGASVEHWPAFPDSAEALAYLKRHYKLVILSNIDRASFAHSNKKLGVEFDLVITAEDVGSYKPAPAHFERAFAELEKLGVPKQKILHTAQSLFHDHVPAKNRFAMTSIWINRRQGKAGGGATKKPPEDATPDWEVPTMAAMVALHKEHAGG
ncbi:MAG: haloacid dehalogenase type II [Alphaproteobacteria bacterium]